MARLMSQVKGGFYAAAPEAVAAVLERLRPPSTGQCLVLDPCAGEGHALLQLAEGLNAVPYGIELSEDRAATVRDSLPEGQSLAPADFLRTAISYARRLPAAARRTAQDVLQIGTDRHGIGPARGAKPAAISYRAPGRQGRSSPASADESRHRPPSHAPGKRTHRRADLPGERTAARHPGHGRQGQLRRLVRHQRRRQRQRDHAHGHFGKAEAGEASIGRLRGRLHDFHGIQVLCTYHPAYLLPETRPPSGRSGTTSRSCWPPCNRRCRGEGSMPWVICCPLGPA